MAQDRAAVRKRLSGFCDGNDQGAIMKSICLTLLICATLGACAVPGGERPSSLLDFDELGAHIIVTRETPDDDNAATLASR